MRALIIIFGLAFAMTALGSTANAVTWGFNLTTTGDPCSWVSDTTVDLGSPEYDYSWELTEAFLQTEGDIWVSVLDEIQPNSGFGTAAGPVPFNIFDPADPLHIEIEGITCDIYLGVSGGGYGSAYIPNNAQHPLILGTRSGNPVTGAKFNGALTVIPVPGPATVLLLGLGSMLLIRKRRRQEQRKISR
ncbi:MAG: PEP-CTERM sorting domain-containing protein [Planctomycetota bacterium]|jgi:hypothetical protein